MSLFATCDDCHLVVPDDLAHHPHEPDCPDLTWCHCDRTLCASCCVCPSVIDGQVEAFPVASTRGLPKKRTA